MAIGNAQGPVWERRLRGKTDVECAEPEKDQGWESDEERQPDGKNGLARRAHVADTIARRQQLKPSIVKRKMTQRTLGSPPAMMKQQWSADRNIKAADHTKRAVSHVRTRQPVYSGDREENAHRVALTADKNRSRNLSWSRQPTDKRPNWRTGEVVDRSYLPLMQNRFAAKGRRRISTKIEVAPWKVARSPLPDSTGPVSATLLSSVLAVTDGGRSSTCTTTAFGSVSVTDENSTEESTTSDANASAMNTGVDADSNYAVRPSTTEELPLSVLRPMNNEKPCTTSVRGDEDGCTEADSSMFDAALPAHSIIDLSMSAASPTEELMISVDELDFGDLTTFSQAVLPYNTAGGSADIEECTCDSGNVVVGCDSGGESGTSNSRGSAVVVSGAEVTRSNLCKDGGVENISLNPPGGFDNVVTPQTASRRSDGLPDGGRVSLQSSTSTPVITSASVVTSSLAAEGETTETESDPSDAEVVIATDQDAAAAGYVAILGSLGSHLDDATDSALPSDRASELVAAAATSTSVRSLKASLANVVEADGRIKIEKSTPGFDDVGSGSNFEVASAAPLLDSVDLHSSMPSTSNAKDNAAGKEHHAEVEYSRATLTSSSSPVRQARLSPGFSSPKKGVASSLTRSDSSSTRAATGQSPTSAVRRVRRNPELRAIISPKRALLKRTFECLASSSSFTSADGAAIARRSSAGDITSTSGGGGLRPIANAAGLRESVHLRRSRVLLAPSSLPCLSPMSLAAASAPHAQTPIETSGAPAAVSADNNARDLPAPLRDSKATQTADNGDVRSPAAGAMNILKHNVFFVRGDDRPSASPQQPGDNKRLIGQEVAMQTAVNKLQVSLARCKAELVVKQRVVEEATKSREALWITYNTLLDSFNHVTEESTKLRIALTTERKSRAKQARIIESSTGVCHELGRPCNAKTITAKSPKLTRVLNVSARVELPTHRLAGNILCDRCTPPTLPCRRCAQRM